MIRRTGIILAMTLGLMGSKAVFAQEAAQQPKELPPFLLEQRVIGADIKYLGFDYGFHSWLATKDGQVQFFYSLPDSEAVISGGLLIGPDGELVTARRVVELDQEAPGIAKKVARETRSQSEVSQSASAANKKNSGSLGEKLYGEAEGAHWIAFGSEEAPPLYVFVDTQCPYCHEYWRDLEDPFVEEGKVQVRLIPVAILNDKSVSEASVLLSAPEPPEAWQRHVAGDTSALRGVGDNAISLQAVTRNTEIFENWNLRSTPYSIYRDPTGAVKVVRGMQPGKAKVVVSDLSGHSVN